MKKIKPMIARPFFLLLLTFVLGGCYSDFKDMNKNPNALTTLDAEYLFSNAVKKTFLDTRTDWKLMLHFGSQYSHFYVAPHNTTRPHDTYKDNLYTEDYFDIYSQSYIGPLKLTNEVIRLTREGGDQENELRNALAQVVAMVNYARLTDLYGDIPYTDGGWGREGVLSPKYDEQKFIYEDMMTRLKNCIDIIKAGDPAEAYPGFDPLYDNDLDKWVRFANSFRLRLAMRARFADEQFASQVISECVQEELIMDPDQNAQIVRYDNPDLYNNWDWIYGMIPWKMSKKLVDWLKGTSDPRLQAWVEPTSFGEYRGVPNGLTDLAFSKVYWDSISGPTPALYARDMPVYFLTTPEVRFLLAEAALIGLDGGDANTYYREGIRMAMEQWNIPDTAIRRFLDQEPEASLWGSEENRLRQIATQKWLSFATNFIQAYTSIRRTGYPEIPRRTAPWLDPGVTNGYLPKRFKYPKKELAINYEHVMEAIERQGPNEISTPVWWDVKGD